MIAVILLDAGTAAEHLRGNTNLSTVSLNHFCFLICWLAGCCNCFYQLYYFLITCLRVYDLICFFEYFDNVCISSALIIPALFLFLVFRGSDWLPCAGELCFINEFALHLYTLIMAMLPWRWSSETRTQSKVIVPLAFKWKTPPWLTAAEALWDLYFWHQTAW